MVHSNFGGGEDLMLLLLLIGTLLLFFDEASDFAVVDVVSLLLNAQLFFRGRTQFVHTLACCFRHTVQWFAGMCENLVSAFRDGLRNAFDLSKNIFFFTLIKWNKIYGIYMQKCVIKAKRLRTGWLLRLRENDHIDIATKKVRESAVC